ncbi:MAG: hypothetical protein HQK84_08595 [Nitrospinae bacterium]|nr:hypothetical protein [Nitrospinota bacterium]
MVGPGLIIFFPFLTMLYGSETCDKVSDTKAKRNINITLLIAIFGWVTLTGLAWVSETEKVIAGKHYHFDLLGFPHELIEESSENIPENLQNHLCVRCHSSSKVRPTKGANIINAYFKGVHAEQSILCQECHGGNSKMPKEYENKLTDEMLKDAKINRTLRKAAKTRTGYKGAPDPQELGEYCGKCHEKVVDNYKESLHSVATMGGFSASQGDSFDDEEFEEGQEEEAIDDVTDGEGASVKKLGTMRGCIDCHEIHGAQRAGLRNFEPRTLYADLGRKPYKGCSSSECHQPESLKLANDLKNSIVGVTSKMHELEHQAHELGEKGVFVSSKSEKILEGLNKVNEKELRIKQHSGKLEVVKPLLEEKEKWNHALEEDLHRTESVFSERVLFFAVFSGYMFILILLVSRYINLMQRELDTPTDKEESDIPICLDLKRKDD